MSKHRGGGIRTFLSSRSGIVLLGFLAIAGYFLWQEHALHIVGYLPLILILSVCVGMHFFMHGSHGGGHGSHKDDSKDGGEQ